jgi:CBS-domain-containing membrane protein
MNFSDYLAKMRGGAKSPPGVGLAEHLWSWAGAFIGIGACGVLSSFYLEPRDLTLLIGSFGASAVLVYSAIRSPLAQP